MLAGATEKGKLLEMAKASAKLENMTKSARVIFTTISIFPETELEQAVKDGAIVVALQSEVLTPEKRFIELLDI